MSISQQIAVSEKLKASFSYALTPILYIVVSSTIMLPRFMLGWVCAEKTPCLSTLGVFYALIFPS